jgi:hypothetical protein
MPQQIKKKRERRKSKMPLFFLSISRQNRSISDRIRRNSTSCLKKRDPRTEKNLFQTKKMITFDQKNKQKTTTKTGTYKTIRRSKKNDGQKEA